VENRRTRKQSRFVKLLGETPVSWPGASPVSFPTLFPVYRVPFVVSLRLISAYLAAPPLATPPDGRSATLTPRSS